MQISTEVYACKSSTRVVVPLAGDITANRFLLATSAIGDNNEVEQSRCDAIRRFT